MRPGRLDRILYVSPPDSNARKEIFQVNFRRMAVNPDVNVDVLTEMVSEVTSPSTSAQADNTML